MICDLRHRGRLFLLFILLLPLFPACTSLTQLPVEPVISKVDSLDTVIRDIEQYHRKRQDKVLVIFDIDNTLVTMPQDLGSVAWYEWQSRLAKTPGVEPEEIGKLLDVQGIILSLSEMVPTQQNVAGMINTLKSSGHTVLALTARGPENSNATQRVLQTNNIQFSSISTCGEPLCKPHQAAWMILDDTAKQLLGAKALVANNYKFNRYIRFDSGILFSSGQNKGIALRLLLESIGHDWFGAIFFVDDSQHNIANLKTSWRYISKPLRLYQYTRFDKDVADFLQNVRRQKKTHQQWQQLKKAICQSVSANICEN